jgi:rubredoxin
MNKYECIACGYVYNPEKGDRGNSVMPSTAFEELPENWVCPTCGAKKTMFDPVA